MNATADAKQDAWSPVIRALGEQNRVAPDTAGGDSDVCPEPAPLDARVLNRSPASANGRLLPGLKRVIVPIDGSDVADEALPVALLLGRRLNAPLHLIGVLDPQRLLPPALAYLTAVNPSIFRELLSTQILEMQERLEHIVREFKHERVGVTYALLRGSLERCVEQTASVGDVVIMALPGRPSDALPRSLGTKPSLSREAETPSIVVFGPLHSPIGATLPEQISAGGVATGDLAPAGTVV